MPVLLPWLRRGTAPLVFLAFTCFLGVVIVMEHPWAVDAQWGLLYLAGASVLLAPLAAGAVAFDVAQRQRPTVADVCQTTARGRVGILAPAISVLLAVLLVFVVVAAAVEFVVHAAGGMTQLDGWVAPELICSYLAVVLVGAAVGSLVRGPAAPVLAALGVLVSPLIVGIASRSVAASLFSIGHLDGTSLGLRRSVSDVLLSMGSHLVIALVACGAIWWAGRAGPWPRWWIAVSVVAVSGSLAWQAVAYPKEGSWEASSEPVSCIGTRPGVCGPQRAVGLMTNVQGDFARAYVTLADSGLGLPDTYVYDRSPTGGWSATSAHLSVNPEDIRGGHLPVDAIIMNLVAPRRCAGFFGSGDSMVLAAQDTTVQWLRTALTANKPTGLAPTDVRRAYDSLLTCTLQPAR